MAADCKRMLSPSGSQTMWLICDDIHEAIRRRGSSNGKGTKQVGHRAMARRECTSDNARPQSVSITGPVRSMLPGERGGEGGGGGGVSE